MLAGARDVWIISRDCSCLSRPDQRRSSPCLRNFVDVKSDFLSAERCPVTAEAAGSSPVVPAILSVFYERFARTARVPHHQ
jgi:hypothetical protein